MKKNKLIKFLFFSFFVFVLSLVTSNMSEGRVDRCMGNNDNECKIYNKRGKLKRDGTGAVISVSIWKIIF
jgi:hypothetical protein